MTIRFSRLQNAYSAYSDIHAALSAPPPNH